MVIVFHISIIHTGLKCPFVTTSTFLLLNFAPNTIVFLDTHHIEINGMDQVSSVIGN